ncbi:hypothetical protein E3983_12345 [Legionella israelensis]|uniref:Uncharacterized protein n=1 Tax=Legionella israelensis TaxID=454 RepID=A0AAX1EIW2_9GAMM|nr:hypothetical protein [Legionella israelensis]QBR85070.1 hypothetical protein E3983_12345 [Legionella israelensis]
MFKREKNDRNINQKKKKPNESVLYENNNTQLSSISSIKIKKDHVDQLYLIELSFRENRFIKQRNKKPFFNAPTLQKEYIFPDIKKALIFLKNDPEFEKIYDDVNDKLQNYEANRRCYGI